MGALLSLLHRRSLPPLRQANRPVISSVRRVAVLQDKRLLSAPQHVREHHSREAKENPQEQLLGRKKRNVDTTGEGASRRYC